MRQLPEEAARLCVVLNAPVRLVSHLTVVHDTACKIVQGLRKVFPNLSFDAEAVCFGAAIHDMGKCVHLEELTAPGNKHEESGQALLMANGVHPHLARFARLHGKWDREPVELEDLLTSLADHVWRGCRNEKLETMIVERISSALGIEQWKVFELLDDILNDIKVK
ncbi:MAG: phosphohydrolase [Planctomycetaceae bacterium]|nr:MAG: phosphohydrolase [Planctomycetaceae bacterium]